MKINFELVFESSLNSTLIHDAEGRLIQYNTAATEVLGIHQDRSVLDAIREDGTKILDAEFPAMIAIKTGKPLKEFTIGIQSLHGSVRWFVVSSVPLYDATQAKVEFVISTFVETTKTQHLGVELKNLWTAIDRSSLFSVTNVQGVITQVNDNFCRASGYARENLIGQNHRILNSGFHELSFFEGLWSTLLEGRVWSGTIRNRRKNGSLYWIDCVISPLFSTSGSVDRFISISADVTERKMAEGKMIESSKLIALGEMAGGIAHEINNPLTVISGKTSLMSRLSEKGELTPESLKSSLEKIDLMSQRISKIVNGLRNFARGTDQDPFETIPASKLIENTLSLCSERFKNHGIRMEISEIPEVEVIARSAQVSQVMMNLLSNSFDAISQFPEKWVKIDLSVLANGRLAIKVVDSGKGLQSTMAKKVMEPFFTTKPPGKGTGLGLSISKAIAVENGGDLYLEEKATNTTFVFELKISE